MTWLYVLACFICMDFYGTLFNFFFTQDHMGLKMSKRYSSYSVHPISAIFYDDSAYHEGCRLFLFVVIGQVVENIVAL